MSRQVFSSAQGTFQGYGARIFYTAIIAFHGSPAFQSHFFHNQFPVISPAYHVDSIGIAKGLNACILNVEFFSNSSKKLMYRPF